MDEFIIKFNKNRQFLNVYIHDVHPTTFQNWGGGRWGYFIAKWDNPRVGFFGEFHCVKSGIREDTVAHEMFHVLCEWIWANRLAITGKNEERFAEFLDELVHKFYINYRKK